jgi:pilus assembly protein FimV
VPVPAVAPPPPAPAPAPMAPMAVKAPVPQPEQPSFVSSLLESPLVLPLAAVLVALIGGLGIYRLRGRMRKPAGETSFLESRLQPDSFFGASGGQRIDTHESSSSAGGSMSSMSYSLSQLDAIGDVDPVAEADVYLAYGRDLQAEEILKEAMRANPDRMAIRTKLLEVYAKRRDAKGFELLATQVFSLTHGTGEDWARAQELGRQFDPENPMYQPGAAPELAVGASGKVIEPLGATTMPHTAKPVAPSFVPAEDATLSGGGPDVDLDLDLAAAHGAAPAPASAPVDFMPDEALAEFAPEHVIEPDAALDFDIPDTASIEEPGTQPGALSVSAPPVSEAGGLDFDLGDFGLDKPTVTEPLPVPEATLDFSDFGVAGGDTQLPPLDGDPLARKLELAEEFRQIGDLEGARDLLEEVIAKADGVLKNKAQGMLAALG